MYSTTIFQLRKSFHINPRKVSSIMVTKMRCSYVAVSIATTMPMSISMSIMLGMVGMPDSLHNSIETTVGPSNVVHHSNSTISFLKGVRSLHVVPVSVLVLFFLVSGVRIMNCVVKVVASWPLETQTPIKVTTHVFFAANSPIHT